MTDTQCMIAVQEKDNTVSAVLLEHGGELAQAGKTLLDSYQDYEQVLKYAPEHEGALTGLVRVDLAENKMRMAYDDINHLLELHGKNPQNYILRAEVEEAMGKLMLAIDDVSTAIEMEGDKIAANQRLGYNDDFTQYVLRRIDLYKKQMAKLKKKSDKEYKTLIEKDQKLLMSKGLPSQIFRK